MEIHLQAGRLAVNENTTWRALCRVDEIADGASVGFPAPPGGFVGLFALRRGDLIYAYVNSCPHIGLSLDWAPGNFLSSDRSRIVCANHGAEFVIETGRCVAGPCLGERLEPVMIHIEDGVLHVPEDAGR
jgi:nitrite reductase/ring-hydroxylating ferredoxin subunit